MARPRTDGNQRQWREIRASIIGALDVLDEYTLCGLVFATPPRPDGNGDVTPLNNGSLRVNVKTGEWYEFNGAHGGGLFQYAVHAGRFSDWRAAEAHYAARAGVTLPTNGRGIDRDPRGRPRPVSTRPITSHVPQQVEQWRDNLEADAERLHIDALDAGDVDRIAWETGLAPHALQDCLVGVVPSEWFENDRWNWHGGYSTWPEWVAAGGNITMMSMNQRGPGPDKAKPQKRCLKNRPRGLTIPNGWEWRVRARGVLLIGEGGTDTASATSCEIGALGYWSAGQGAEYLADVIFRAIDQRRIPRRFIIVLTRDIDSNGKPNGGTAKIGQHLANSLNLPVYQRVMPDGFKDVRAYLNARAPDAPACGRRDKHLVGVGDSLVHALVGPVASLDHYAAHADTFLPTDPDGCYEKATDEERAEELARRQDKARRQYGQFWTTYNPATRHSPLCVRNHGGIRWLKPNGIPWSVDLTPKCASMEGVGRTDKGIEDQPNTLIGPSGESHGCAFERENYDRLVSCGNETCPRPFNLMMERVETGRWWNATPRCGKWQCPECAGHRRLEWATVARQAMTDATGDVHVWRGSYYSYRSTVRKRVHGDWLRIQVGEADAVVVAATAFTGSTPVSPVAADAELMAALAALRPTVATATRKRTHPVRGGGAWKVERPCGARSSTLIGGKLDVPGFGDALVSMGFVERGAGGREEYDPPPELSDSEKANALAWANLGMAPIGWVLGSPESIPSPGGVDTAALIDDPDGDDDDGGRWPVPPAPPVPPVVRPRPRKQRQPSLPMTTEGNTIPADLEWAKTLRDAGLLTDRDE